MIFLLFSSDCNLYNLLALQFETKETRLRFADSGASSSYSHKDVCFSFFSVSISLIFGLAVTDIIACLYVYLNYRTLLASAKEEVGVMVQVWGTMSGYKQFYWSLMLSQCPLYP